MKETKFRFYHPGNQAMYYFSLADAMFATDKYAYEIGLAITMDWLEVNSKNPDKEERIMTFTGLKDKNAQEIYEGDIFFNTKWTGGCKGRIVEWNASGGFCCFCDGEYGEDPNEVEIIGNIYENPNLLEEK